MIDEIKYLTRHGKQYIPDLRKAVIPFPFRGRPVISTAKVDVASLVSICPLDAISADPVSIDLGKCAFCGECAFAFPEKVKFTNDHKIASNDRNNLVIREGEISEIKIDAAKIRKEIRSTFGRSLKLREVSSGGDNSCEMELSAAGNANFDIGRYGIEFVASPRHADGIVITGPGTENMSEALNICYNAIPSPRIVILAGTDAISGGIFEGSPALNRSFITEHTIDLFVPGNPVHPLTFINGVLDLLGMK
jgi:Ni,Fe-hydrogenase III small subunit